MLLTVEQLVDKRVVPTTLDLGAINKFTGSRKLNDLLFSSLLNIFQNEGVLDSSNAKEEEVLSYREKATQNFVLRASKTYFETEPSMFVSADYVFLNDIAKERYERIPEETRNRRMSSLIELYRNTFDKEELSDKEVRLISVLYMIRATDSKAVIFHMDVDYINEDLLTMIEKDMESFDSNLKTVIFYEDDNNKVVYGGLNEFATREVKIQNSNESYEKFYRSV
ncbi:hypothetical protein P9X10_02265 [Bacillus cereus]|nr:hypothetical protein [Bacillus cereus]